jgi:hypothetical protein
LLHSVGAVQPSSSIAASDNGPGRRYCADRDRESQAARTDRRSAEAESFESGFARQRRADRSRESQAARTGCRSAEAESFESGLRGNAAPTEIRKVRRPERAAAALN